MKISITYEKNSLHIAMLLKYSYITIITHRLKSWDIITVKMQTRQ